MLKNLKKILIWGVIIGMLSAFIVPVNAATPNIPSVGAYQSGIYRNLFAEAGHSDAEIQAKIDAAWNSLYKGDSNHTLMYDFSSDESYIKDVNNNDIRSEGQSYGMMVCVQLDKKTEFNKLWKFAKNRMQHSSGQFKGFFAWQVNTSGGIIDSTPASDGDEYFAMSLLFASKRWGDGSGIFNYSSEANIILDAMLHQSDDGQGYNMFNSSSNQVVFCPSAGNYDFTDPSYHLPAFYELWALWGPERDRAKWSTIAAASRQFFQKTVNSTTGLAPDYASFDGRGYHASFSSDAHEDFRYDAWRTVQNCAVDFAWWMKDSFAKTYSDKIQNFFYNQGLSNYGNCFTLSGNKTSSDHSPGLVAMNAAASLSATTSKAYDFVEELWKTSPPSGQYRYYDGCLLMFGLLHCSGNFKIWGAAQVSNPPSNVVSPTPVVSSPGEPTGDLNNDGAINIGDVMIVAASFNSVRGDSRYVAACDLNNDGAVNLADVMFIAERFNTLVSVKPSNTATTAPSPTATTKPISGKLVALTFDDGPSSQTTKTLDKLSKYNVKATFMLIGSKISSADSVMKRIVSDGHECGNHSWDYTSMNGMSSSQISDSVNRTSSAIKQYSGTDPKFFRAPNLATSQTMFSTIRLTFVQGVICQDWQGGSAASSASAIANLAVSGVRDGSIVLLHSDQPEPHYTPDALDTIIPQLKNQGYTFVTLSELFAAKGKTPPLGVSVDGAF